MKEKQNDIFTISLVAAILLIFAVADLFAQAGPFSAKYDALAPKPPVFTSERFLRGEYAGEFETYTEENFRNHEKFRTLWQDLEILFGRRDVNGVFLGSRNTFFEQHPAEDYTEEMERASLEYLRDLAQDWDAGILLVPTLDAILPERLPVYAGVLDQQAYLQAAKEQVGEAHWIDGWGALKEHAAEEIYFRTDPHWTALGAYYGYLAWAQKEGIRWPYYYDPEKMIPVTHHFLGMLHTKSGRYMEKETLWIFPQTQRKGVQIVKEDGTVLDGYYRREALGGDDPYAYFLGEETGSLRIQTGRTRAKNLLLVGDSYAHAIAAFLAPHYREIYLVNPGLIDGSVEEIAREYEKEGDFEVLVVQGVPDFLELFGGQKE